MVEFAQSPGRFKSFATLLHENSYVDVGLIVLMGLVFFGGALSGDWRWDDPQILLHLHQFSILSDFIDPAVWQQFSPANLTPWLIFSFEIDLILFGVNPSAFYLHQVLALIAAAVALYALLRLWVGNYHALFGALLLLAGAPSFVVIEQLMTRQYVEGLVFCLLAVFCFVQFLRGRRNLLLLLAAVFYLLAVTAKEIYVPLVLLLPFIELRERGFLSRSLFPFIAIAVVYVLWRGWMLGSLTGGYTESSEYLNIAYIPDVLNSFSQFPKLLLGSLWIPFCVLFIALLGTYAITLRSRLLISFVVLALVLLPLVPLVGSPGIIAPDRYLFLFWCVISFAMAFYAGCLAASAKKSNQKAMASILWIVTPVAIVLSLFSNSPYKEQLEVAASEYDVQARFLWQSEGNTAFIPSPILLPSFWFVTGLQDFKSGLIPDSSSPSAIVDTFYLENNYEQLYQYEQGCVCMQSITDSIDSRRAQFQSLLREEAPLSLTYSYNGGIFDWEFGPHTEGSYHVVSDVLGVIPVPLAGRMRVTVQDNVPFFLKYTAPEGWISYSSEQYIKQDSPEINWVRE